MTRKRPRQPLRASQLENEVILAVVALYLMISGALLAIHHLQPADAVTLTSSPSPSHVHFATPRPADPASQPAPAAPHSPATP